jgi:primosomal protein N' (replication factor Y)
MRVVVPFGRGNRRTEGFVLLLEQQDTRTSLKSVESQLDQEPVMDDTMLRLAAFLRERYFCTFFDAIRAMLPAGLWFHARDKVVLTALGQSVDLEESLKKSPEAVQVAQVLRDFGGQAEVKVLARMLDGDVLDKGIKQLVKKNMAISEGTLVRNVGDKTEQIAALAVSSEEAAEYAKTRKRAPLQKAVLEMLMVLGSCAVKELKYFTGASTAAIRTLEKAGYVELTQREQFRRPQYQAGEAPREILLNQEQQAAYESVAQGLDNGGQVSLLYGVTGSGKTMVYLKLIEACLGLGKSALVLVPEIALTPQLMQTFMGQFGDQVAVLHSALQVGQRYDEWKRIRTGLATVVVGTRSAVFAPLRNLGLIVVDEEHEHSYKSEMNPRYHAREVAIWRGVREKAQVVLGSATPSLETMYLAQQGTYQMLKLTERFGGQTLPQVVLADMKEELQNGNSGILSARLREEMEENFRHGEQTILYLNRRGASRTVLCPVCGHVPECPRCSVSLTYHSANHRLMCHYCGYSQPATGECPDCGSTYRQVGTGTQKVEEELHSIWPWIETIRMDADTVSASNPHDKILSRFRQEKIPVLIGTQMVTKGLNFPNVTLVGVLDGDSALYTDDFRASENTFSKITQVVGRAGRGDKPGRAVIQTMTPENQVLMQAACQDYDGFYATELPLRQLQGCPPYRDVLQVKFFGVFEDQVAQGALRFRQALGQSLRNPQWQDQKITLMGPAPAPVVRVMNRYHYQLTILAKNSKELRALLSSLLKWFAGDKANHHITACVDVNPLG